MDLEKEIISETKIAIVKALNDALTGYNGPVTKLCQKVIDRYETELLSIIDSEFSSLLGGPTFKDDLKSALNTKLAKVLVGRMGGELEKRVNELKQNPATRARITTAIDKIIEEL